MAYPPRLLRLIPRIAKQRKKKTSIITGPKNIQGMGQAAFRV
jgi:hypothetical protein